MRTLNRLPILFALPALVALAGCEIEGTEGVEPKPYVPTGGSGGGYLPPPVQPTARSFTILHTNDEHSHLLGFGPNSEYPYLPAAVDLGTDTTCTDETTPTGCAAVPGGICEWTMSGCAGSGASTLMGAWGKYQSGVGPDSVGGFVRRDFLLNKLRSEATDPVLTISAGDYTQGTIFNITEPVAAPSLLAMYLAGYDYTTLGNHEFDWGPDVIGMIIQSAANIGLGSVPKIIASNTHFDDVDTSDPTSPGNLLFSQYGEGGSGALIQPWDIKVLANGLRIGLLGAMGFEAQFTEAFKDPISFSVPKDGDTCTDASTCAAGETCTQGYCVDPLDAPGHIAAAAAEIQGYVNTLRSKGVDVVVLISHMGTDEDYAVAMMTSGIDVIIGGHSHDYLPAYVIPGTSTIRAEADSFGTALGQLTVTVDPDGTVSLDESRTALHDIDQTLDAQIFAGTSLPTPSPALERAMTLTLGVIGPVMGQLNAMFAPSVSMMTSRGTITDLWSPMFADRTTPLFDSPHDIPGSGYGEGYESHLIHLAADAEWLTVAMSSCYTDMDGPGTDIGITGAEFIVAIESAGVPKDDLEFGADGSASFADVYRAMPNYISPFQPTIPGNPLVAFQFTLPNLVAGLDIGFTRGLASPDFFLSYGGMRAEYDTSFPAFNPATFLADLMEPSPNPLSRLKKLELLVPGVGYHTIFEYDTADTTTPWIARWNMHTYPNGTQVDFANDTALVVLNLFTAGSMFTFGLEPLDPLTGAEVTGSVLEKLGKLTLCNIGTTTDCTPAMRCPTGAACPGGDADCGGVAGSCQPRPLPSIAQCVYPTGGNIPASGVWEGGLIEVKEWAAVFGYLQAFYGGTLGDCDYASEETNANCTQPFPSRVIDATE